MEPSIYFHTSEAKAFKYNNELALLIGIDSFSNHFSWCVNSCTLVGRASEEFRNLLWSPTLICRDAHQSSSVPLILYLAELNTQFSLSSNGMTQSNIQFVRIKIFSQAAFSILEVSFFFYCRFITTSVRLQSSEISASKTTVLCDISI